MTPHDLGWTNEDHAAAVEEGWDIFECDGSDHGNWQIQKSDELDMLKDDEDAWRLVLHGNKPHHNKALAIIKILCIEEYDRIVKVGPRTAY